MSSNLSLPPGLGGSALPKQAEQILFDENVPADGWEVALPKNVLLCEDVGQLPRSNIIKEVKRTNARSDKEWHMIVHDISPDLDEKWNELGVKRGERILFMGAANQCFFNGMLFNIVPCNAVNAVLRRKDGELWIGSQYGEDALKNGKPAKKG